MLNKTKMIKKDPIFLENWENAEDVFKDFEVYGFRGYDNDKFKPESPKNIKILFAYYTYEDYS
jgi:hypothetical protein